MRRALLGAFLAAAVTWGGAAEAQANCEDRENWGGDRARDRAVVCEVRQADVVARGVIRVDGGQNGGVKVGGWDRDDVVVESQVWARARSESRAEELVSDVRILTDSGYIRAEGPRSGRGENWGVTFWVYAPHDSDLELEAHNGGISIEDIHGRIDFKTQNGGVRLDGVGGDVYGRTQNGGVTVHLDGTTWDGQELDVETQNGGVNLVIPEGYSADLETGTVNGGIEFDFPITLRGRVTKRIETQLGEGGPLVRVVTTNGGVKIRTDGRSRIR
jgi:DUF4097 and DUF4098 domain-containing protein YvlB